MQRPAYSSIPPAQSPPLHHPIPQHVSTVPHLRSPPPPVSQNGGNGYGNSPQSQGQQAGMSGNTGNNMHPAFGGFMDDNTARLAMGFAGQGIAAGQQVMEQNFNRFVNVSALKHYFNVSNAYVLRKLLIVLFPWRHKPWSRQVSHNSSSASGSSASFLPPREDVNSPDMYIPIMAFTTYVLLSTLIAGVNGKFKPELLSSMLGNAGGSILLEQAILWLGRYFLSINSESQFYDLISYSGYKFVGVIVTLVVAAFSSGGRSTRGWVGYSVLGYTFMANAFFLLRSLKYVLLPSDSSPGNPSMQTIAKGQRRGRMQFLFIYTYVVQFALMWWLTRLDWSPVRAGK
nr:hypothetical protein B0A51_12566 [Rachicladosporium sp. CCFEE 5018]